MQFLFGATVEFEPWIEKANDVDMYIYLDKQGVPYVDDGTQLPLTERNLLDEYHQNNIFKYRNEYVKTFSFNSTINPKEAYEERFNNVIKEVDKFINEF
jgi:nicotinamide riboside kinase